MTLFIIAQKKSAYKRVSLLENVDNTTWYLNAQNKRSAIRHPSMIINFHVHSLTYVGKTAMTTRSLHPLKLLLLR